MVEARETLERLARERGVGLAQLSAMLGRNAAYIQQFVRRGSPRKLDEADRAKLARFFDVDEAVLGGPVAAPARRRDAGLRIVARLPLGASAGPGALADDERPQGGMGFEPRFLKALTANPDAVSLIRVTGDSMVPTLSDGDDILVDTADAADRLRDGIYVLRIDDAINVKRVAMRAGKRFTIVSDNPAYPPLDDWHRDQVTVIGRVIWVGRRVS